MKNCILFIITLFYFNTNTNAQSQKIKGFQSPESILLYKDNLYISNVGKELKPSEKDNDGFISICNKKGEIINEKFITNLHAPKGMAQIKNILFVADIDKIKAFDITNGAFLYEIEIAESKFLNAIEVINKNIILVSATDIDVIYRINISTKKVEKTAFKGANGINGMAYQKSKKRLYVVGFGNNGKNGRVGYFNVEKENLPITFLTNLNGYFDGCEIAGKYLYISDWGDNYDNGRLIRLDIKHGWLSIFAEMKGPADIAWKNKRIFAPEMKKGNIYIINPKDYYKYFN
jgi:hypothetical protein